MTHSHPQGQQRRLLSKFLNQLDQQLESSLSSSQKPFSNSIQTSTAATTTTSCSSRSSFGSKLLSSSHQNFYDHHSLPVSCCFKVSSRLWSILKLGCSDISLMKSQVELSVHSSSEIRKKKLSGQQKKEELEKEVSLLQMRLHQEEKVHEILEMAHARQNGAAISIPNFLPPKMKELLAELAMVEGEIARLESQIVQLQAGLNHEKEVTKEPKSKIWSSGTLSNSFGQLLTATNPSPSPINRSFNEGMAFETKALHFISKAIKGDYKLNDFSLNDKSISTRPFADQKENNFHEDVKIQDRFPRKRGIQKPSSPLRDTRHPSPKPRERNPDIYLDLPPKPLSDPLLSEENSLKWQPNKLSESIMKCLNFIYVRLLRTSRAMELEKSGPISRSIHSSLSSRSFRVETGFNPKSSPMVQKESRQQDPYGIFNIEESIPRDIGPYKNLVIFTSSSMDPKYISNPSSIPLLRKLRVLMNNLQTIDLGDLTYQQRLAFWINMYNACIMHGFIQYGVPSTPEKLLTLMNKATLIVGGNTINAQAIEHFILRRQAAYSMKEALRKGEKDEKESIVRQLYGLQQMDPNVTFALCCGTRSSPAVRIYTAEGVTAELEKSKLDYLQASIMVTSTKRIALPELLLRNMLDFAIDTDRLVKWVCHQLPTSGTLRKSMVDCFRGHNTSKASSIVEKIAYDYEFQYLLTI
ncbi:Ternary complex factor MIP1, leucine-zipper [Quillaja saponaria]|uniref:Ternary complex factor MIP1, leucine-zipper n=1 Tax=Quillaja saponaria TaxID=32244 RepID=A0AAD7KY79_QUISA|nr:Ternary complex factor MIP1, leucine-zipper [Quillaja saponaria]